MTEVVKLAQCSPKQRLGSLGFETDVTVPSKLPMLLDLSAAFPRNAWLPSTQNPHLHQLEAEWLAPTHAMH